MKKVLYIFLALVIMAALISCGDGEANDHDDDSDIIVGGDWHTTGMYTFYELDGIIIAVKQHYSDTKEFIGYEVWADGESGPGEYYGALLFADGGHIGDEIDQQTGLLIEDKNGDGKGDIGIRASNGDVMWFMQITDETGDSFTFSYSNTETTDA